MGKIGRDQVQDYARRKQMTIEEAQRQLSQEGGLKGLSGGLSNDVRDLEEAAAKGNARAQLAIDVFVSEARRWIGGYFFQLNGADAIVFTAGIGENCAELREAICANLDQLGIRGRAPRMVGPRRDRHPRC